MDKKGFLFTVTIFLILTYILISISVWVKSIEASERSFSQFYQESTVELSIEQITQEKLETVSDIIMNRNLFRLDENSITYPLKTGPEGSETKYAKNVIFDLLMNGSSTNPEYFQSSPGDLAIPESNSSLTAWAGNLNSSLRAIGIYINQFEVSNFTFEQSSIDKIKYSFDMKLELKDYTNTSAVSRNYKISREISITGLVDPALARESKNVIDNDSKTIYRQFFFNKDYANSSDISITQISPSKIYGGQGWLYGSLALAAGTSNHVPSAISVPSELRYSYILVGTFDEIHALSKPVYDEFGGYIITDEPKTSDSGCGPSKLQESNTFNALDYTNSPECKSKISDGGALTDAPFIVASGFDPKTAPDCPSLDGSNQTLKCVLILNTYTQAEVAANPQKKLSVSASGIFGVETIRDFVMCGYYTHNPNAPSYLQRLINNPYSYNSSDFGIETFVVGLYANDYSIYDTNSRLDRELFNGSVHGIKVRGLPGCKNSIWCSDSPDIGIFAVSDETKSNYGLDKIACDVGAGCDS